MNFIEIAEKKFAISLGRKRVGKYRPEKKQQNRYYHKETARVHKF